MNNEKTEVTKILISFPDDLLESIESYRFENRITNRTQTILELIQKGLQKEGSK